MYLSFENNGSIPESKGLHTIPSPPLPYPNINPTLLSVDCCWGGGRGGGGGGGGRCAIAQTLTLIQNNLFANGGVSAECYIEAKRNYRPSVRVYIMIHT